MRDYDYLDFNADDLPQVFYQQIDGTNYKFRLYYNALDDSFHIDIWDDNNVPIVMGEKLVYGEPLWWSVNDPRLPMIDIRPIDDDDYENTVSALNFPSIVKLEFCIDDPFSSDSDNYNDLDDDSDEINPNNDTNHPSQINDNEYGNDPTVGDDQ